jgi:hypothetical protein
MAIESIHTLLRKFDKLSNDVEKLRTHEYLDVTLSAVFTAHTHSGATDMGGRFLLTNLRSGDSSQGSVPVSNGSDDIEWESTTFDSGSGQGWILRTDSSGGLTLNELTMRGYILPYAPDGSSIGMQSLPFRSAHISELFGTRFVEETIQAAGGRWIVPKSTSILDADLTSVDTSVVLPDAPNWQDGDLLIMREVGQVEYMKVLSHSGSTWNLERSIDNPGFPNEWPNGAVIVNLGGIGSGWIEAKGGPDFALSLWQRTGSAYTNTVELMRFGNMKSWNGYPGTDIPGFGIGDEDRFISFDKTYGLRINSPVMIGGNLGFTTDALLYCAFDGPKPYETEYGGSLISHLGRTPTINGGIVFRPGRYGKAIQIAEGTVNLLARGSFETGGSTDGWVGVTGNLPDAYAIETARTLYGSKSGRFRFDAGISTVRGISQSFTAPADGDYTFSGWIWIYGYSAGSLSIDLGTGTRITYSANTNGWVKFYVTQTLVAGTRSARLFTDSTPKFVGYMIIDGLQVEQKSYPTPYCDGSLMRGNTWTSSPSTPFISTSTRVASNLSFTRPSGIEDKFTFCAWIYRGGCSTSNSIFRGNSASSATMMIVLPDGRMQAFWNGTSVTSAVDKLVPIYTWTHVAMTVDESSMTIYINGVSAATPVSVTGYLDVTATAFFIGSNYTSPASSSLNGLIDELMIKDQALSAQDIKAIASSSSPLNIRRGPFDLYLGGGANGGWLIGNGDGLTGYSADGIKQSWFGSDGKIYAGGGEVNLDADGIGILANFTYANFYTNSYKFVDTNKYIMGGMYGSLIGNNSLVMVASYGNSGTTSNAFLTANSSRGVDSASVQISAVSENLVPYYRTSTYITLDATASPLYSIISMQCTYLDIFGQTRQIGSLRLTQGFGCNDRDPQVSYSVGAAASAGGTGTLAGAYDTAAHRDALIALVNKMRTALINNGIAIT